MIDSGNANANLHALLIGIDFYLPNKLPGGCYYRNLSGCVRDISHVEDFLLQKIGISPANILKLTASNAGTAAPPEAPASWPTYGNMVAAFQTITAAAKPRDQVYIHYSGHGGRSVTMLPEIKGPNGLDESLVPTDIGNSEARYLRDVELARLLRTMAEKGLIVTIVLDSCHSGSATRGSDAQVRGTGSIDITIRPTESLVASREELAASWRHLTNGRTRNLDGGSGWLPDSREYVLLAACRASEAAFEYAFDGREANGALTYWMLNSLEDIGPGLTYKQLHNRILAKVHSQFAVQTPQLEGDGNRVVFGSDHKQPVYSALVMAVDPDQKKLLLNVGQSHGVRQGAQFAIYPLLATDFEPPDRLALATTVQVGATESWATITRLAKAEIEQGAQALLVNPGSIKLVRSIRLLSQLEENDPKPESERAALAAVRDVLRGAVWVEEAAANESAQYQLAVSKAGEYEILDRAGTPIERLCPPISVHSRDAAARVVGRLVHLTKYHSVQELDNNDPRSPLARKLVVELAGYQREYDPLDKPEPISFETRGNVPEVRVGEWLFLRVKNISTSILNVTILDLQPDWGITQVHPSLPESFVPLDPGQEELIPFCAALPYQYQKARDVLKVFATVGTSSFHWLQMPALDQPGTAKSVLRGLGSSPLDQLVAAIAAERPTTRNLNPAIYPSREWATTQVEVQVRRPNPPALAVS